MATRVGLVVALCILLSSGFYVFSYVRESSEERLLAQTSLDLARAIDEISSLEGETLVSLGFGGEGCDLPAEVGGEGYTVNVTRWTVTVVQGGRRYLAHLSSMVHAWCPGGMEGAPGGLVDAVDSIQYCFDVHSSTSTGLVIERTTLQNGWGPLSFVYPADIAGEQSHAAGIAGEIAACVEVSPDDVASINSTRSLEASATFHILPNVIWLPMDFPLFEYVDVKHLWDPAALPYEIEASTLGDLDDAWGEDNRYRVIDVGAHFFIESRAFRFQHGNETVDTIEYFLYK